MAKSTAVSLILIDGTASGRIKCTIKSRTGIIFKIPRKDLSKCKDRDELKHDGVYFLLGENKIYIGQAGSRRKNGKGIINRLNEHNRNPDKNFWTEAIIFTTLDNSFGSTEISWLENKFCNMAIKAARYEVDNGNDPSPGNITEEKEIELEDHAAFAQLVLSVIGYKIFEPKKISALIVKPTDEEIFYLSRKIKALGRTINAQMKITPTGYKVLAGSEISPLDDTELSANVKKARRAAKIDSNGILLEDKEFDKPSPAATFVLAMPTDGNREWKRNGEPLKKFLEEK